MAWDVEVTDTFGGESNYSWVKRYVVPGTPNHLSLVRQAKKMAGWSGLRCLTADMGDMLEVRPVGRSAPCWIMFINWKDRENTTEDT